MDALALRDPAMKALTAAEMREVDRLTTARFSIAGLQLMEAAGQHVCDAIVRSLGGERAQDSRQVARVSILCGKGNNGGDGLVAGRHLKARGIEAKVYFFGDPTRLTGDAGENLQRWRNAGGTVEVVDNQASWEKIRRVIADSHVIVDALLGTGLRGPATGLIAQAISSVNEISQDATAPRPSLIIAVDMPSGLPSDGEPAKGPVLRVHKTVTFSAPKIGQLTSRDAVATGALEVLQIGSPPELVDELGQGQLRWAEAEEFAKLPLVRGAGVK